MNCDFSIIERKGVRLISVDCINRLGNYRAFYSTGFGGVSDMPGGCTMNLSMFKNCRNDTFENVRRNFEIFADACGFPLNHLSLNREVHEPHARIMSLSDLPEDIFDRTKYPEADIQVTADPDVALFVYAADCCTIMLVDPLHEVSGTAHCGWRNSLNGTLETLVSTFISCGGSLSGAEAVIGPSICMNHYSLDADAARLFSEAGFGNELGPRNSQDRFPVDLREVNRKILIRQGLDPSRIHIMPWCTWEASDLRLPSYRRDGGLNAMSGGILFRCAPENK